MNGWPALMFIFLSSVFLPERVVGISCFTCPSTSFPLACYQTFCPIGVTTCFTQSWIKDGVTYVQRGCFPITPISCEAVSDRFCEPTNTFDCCTGDLCNNGDPLLDWAVKAPRNLVPVVAETSIELSWDPVCLGTYQFEIQYFRGEDTEGQQPTTLISFSSSVTLHSLSSGTRYQVNVRAITNGTYSEPSTIAVSTLSTTPGGGGDDVTSSQCWHTASFIDAPSTIMDCPNADDVCYSRVEYFANSSATLTSRGCTTKTECEEKEAENEDTCKPGENGARCQFCCNSVGGRRCNSVTWTNAGLTCDNIPPDERILCGWRSINVADCIQRGCCYLPSNDTVAWCHYGKYGTQTTQPPLTQAGLELWLIILIVAVILIILIIVAIIVYCCVKRRREKAKGFYDVYAVPKPREEREARVTTVSRDAYDNTALEV